MGAEKRREHRFSAHLPATVSFGSYKFSGRTDNISRLGCLCEITRQIPEGSHVAVVIDLPEFSSDQSLKGALHAGGSVFRCNPLGTFQDHTLYGIGIFFTRFEQELDKTRLSRFIDFLSETESQQINEALKKRKEKETMDTQARSAEDCSLKEAQFQQETLALLRQIQARLEAIYRSLPPDKTKQ